MRKKQPRITAGAYIRHSDIFLKESGSKQIDNIGTMQVKPEFAVKRSVRCGRIKYAVKNFLTVSGCKHVRYVRAYFVAVAADLLFRASPNVTDQSHA